MALHLMSPAFEPGATLPRRYTCDGEDVSPPLHWSNVPDRTQSFLVFCNSPDAPDGNIFHLWAIYDIPGHWRELKAGYGKESITADALHQAINSADLPGYVGPCPPDGAEHRYIFHVCALRIPTLPVASGATCLEVETVSHPYILAEAELACVYAR
ncbi:MAG TPA: YbhB/YbcL family Raf kinase inhibitor-like protein [Azospirillaceae bacterium]|nr:YbhB/YbcL family Raf kinase inhibitor-like protein [Azospirillaceae bacterium]